LVPNSFQGNRASNTKATYALDGKVHRVQNQCKDAAGKTTGIAKIVEGSYNAKLRVNFFRPFYGNYWVPALDPCYKWVLVGEPKRAFGWVLARDNMDFNHVYSQKSTSKLKLFKCQRAQQVKMNVPSYSITEILNVIKHV
jgi:lipocalin